MEEPHAVPPRIRVGLVSELPMFIPDSEMSVAEAVGAFETDVIVATGASNENVELAVPISESTFATIAREPPEAGGVIHRIRVTDAQDDDVHAVLATAIVGVKLANPKFIPYSVTVVPLVDAPFSGPPSVMTGESYVKPL